MDDFKKTQYKHHIVGWKWDCFCCDIHSHQNKTQAKNKAKARRFARRKLKQQLHTSNFE